jgi:glycosyltransferase involved in cell wall biosynthesis
MEKKILMMINFFPPAAGGGVYRPLAFVKYLDRLSWNVTVIAPKPGGFWISDPGLEQQIPEGARVVRTGSLSGQSLLGAFRKGGGGGSTRPSGAFEGLRRLGEFFLVPDTYRGWAPFAYRAAARLCRQEHFDVLYSTSPPDSTHLVAARCARSFSIPWVADFRDPWMALHLRSTPTPLHRAIHERMERRAVGADRVLVTTEWHEEILKSRYPDCRTVRIPNGFDEEDFEGTDDVRPPGEPFTILHTGMLTLGRTVRPFLEGLALLFAEVPELEGNIRVIFLGARETGNEALVERFGLGKAVHFEDNVPHHECIERELRSHVLLLVKHDDERYRGLVPGKLYEYIGAQRPILAIVPEGEAARTVRDLRRGEVAPIGDASGIAGAIRKMYDLHSAGNLDGAYSLQEQPGYSRRAAAERLSSILESLRSER